MTIKKTQQGLFGKRLKIWMRPRGGGWKVPKLPVWIDTEWHRSKLTGVGYINLTVSDKFNHRPWAFNAYWYYRGV
jgi:hypothetical protein